jgi:hypothetical protein
VEVDTEAAMGAVAAATVEAATGVVQECTTAVAVVEAGTLARRTVTGTDPSTST